MSPTHGVRRNNIRASAGMLGRRVSVKQEEKKKKEKKNFLGWFKLLTADERFSLLRNVQTSSGNHPTSYTLLPVGTAAGAWG